MNGGQKKSGLSKTLVAVVVIALIAAGAAWWLKSRSSSSLVIRYAITPYQDSALPVVPARLGWYSEAGLNVQMVPAVWGDVVTAIAGGGVDVAVYNFNSFQAPYENAAQGPRKPVFYCPFYLFKGQAIMVNAGPTFQPFVEKPGESDADRERRVAAAAAQLKGKRIAATAGTELEQIVLTAISKAGLSPKDVTIIHASPEDALAAFLAGNIDAFAAGLTERVEAKRHGATELLVASDVTLPVIDGLITNEQFAREHQDALDALVRIWFRNIDYMDEDLAGRSNIIRDYLAHSASTRYSPEEYKIAWTFNIFPKTPADATAMFQTESSPSYWKKAWDYNNQFLLQQGKIKSPIPYSAYWGENVLKRVTSNASK